MLSLLYQAVNHKKKKKNSSGVHNSFSMAPGRRNTLVEIFFFLCDARGNKKKSETAPQTLAQWPFMKTLIRVWKSGDTERRRGYARVKRPNQLRRELAVSPRLGPFAALHTGLPSSCLFPPARRWAPTAGLLFFLDKRQFHSPPPVRCVHITLPALPRARTHCLTPAAMWVPYRCLPEISAGLTPFIPLWHALGKHSDPTALYQ